MIENNDCRKKPILIDSTEGNESQTNQVPYKEPAEDSKFYGLESHFNEDVVFYKDVRIFGELKANFSFLKNISLTSKNLHVLGNSIFDGDSYFENINAGIVTARDGLDVGCGGTTLRAVVSTGNVGIGSTIPEQRLDIAGSAKIDVTIYDSVNRPGKNGYDLVRDQKGLRWIPQVAESNLGECAGNSIGVSTDGIFILNGGVPIYPEYIPLTTCEFGNIRLKGTIYDGFNQPGTTGQILAKNSLGSLSWIDQTAITAGAGGGYRSIQFKNSANLLGGATDFVYDEVNLKVGIGTTIPSSKLTVVGNSNFIGIVTASSFIGNLTGTATTATNVIGGIGSLTQLSISGISTFTNGPVLIGSGTSTGTASQALQVNSGVYFSGINSIGIGTTNPQSLLHVYTTSSTSQIIEASNNASYSTLELKSGIGTTAITVLLYSSSLENVAILRNNSDTTGVGLGFAGTRTSGGDLVIFRNTRNVVIGNGPLEASQTGTANQKLQVQSGAYISGNLGIGTTNPTSKLSVEGDGYFSGVVTATTFYGNLIGGISGISSVATKLETARNFSITGNFVTATAISFDGTDNVALAATIAQDSIVLGTYTTGDYVKNISGTTNQITVTSGTGEGSSPTLSIPNQFTVPQDITVTRDLQVNRNLNVTGNITIGGTNTSLFTTDLKVVDPNIVLGVRTDSNNNDISNDTTANHGGISIASTEGTPLVTIYNPGIGDSTLPTYKKIIWLKSGTGGLGTDAWLFNYAVGIGSTEFPSGTRLAVGNVQFIQNDLAVIRNINASGIITSNSSSVTSLTAQQLSVSGISTFTNGPVLIGSGTSTGTANQPLQVTGGAYVSGSLGIGVTNSSVALHVRAAVNTNIFENTGSTESYLFLKNSTSGGYIGAIGNDIVFKPSNGVFEASRIDSSGTFRVKGSGTAGSTDAVQFSGSAPASSLILNTSGNLLINNTSATGTASQPLQVSGGAYVSGNLGVGVTNPTSKIHVVSAGYNTSATTALTLDNNGGWATGLDLKVNYGGFTTSRIVYDFYGYEYIANTPTGSHGLNYVSGRSGLSNHWFRNSAGNTQMVLNNAGNLGIGTETDTGTASQRLQVNGGAYVSGNLGVGATNPLEKLDSRGTVLVATNTNGNNLLAFGNSASYGPLNGAPDGSHGSSFILGNSSNAGGAPSYLSFWTTSGGVVGERARIQSSGEICIGSTTTTGTASQPLQVTGGAYVSGSVGVGNINPLGKLSIYTTSINTPTGYNGQNFGLIIGTDNGDNTYDEGNGVVFTQQYASDGVDPSQVRVGAIVGYKGQPTGNFGGGLKFKVQPTGATPMVDAMVLTKDGNLGIGITIPAQKLHVYQSSGDSVVRLTTTYGTGTEYDLTVGGNGNYSPGVFAIRYATNGTTPFTILPTGQLQISTGPLLIGTATSTGTANQLLQVSGGAYVSGKVGIGTTNPSAKLQVSGGNILLDNNTAATSGGSNNYIGFGTNSISRITGRDNDTGLGFLAFLAGGSEALRIDSSGNVGVGTATPQEKLSVFGGTDQNISANESGTGNSWRARILSKNSSADRSSFLGVYNTSAGVFAHNYALNAWADLYVNTTNSINDGGNVFIAGIGSVAIGSGTAPTYKLDVNGTIRSSASISAWNTTTPGTTVGGFHLGAQSGTTNAGPAITFGARDSDSGTTAQAGIYVNSDGTYGTRMYFATTDSYASGSKVAMYIDSSGAVNVSRSQLKLTSANSTTTGGGQIYLNGTTGNRIDFNTNGIGAPAAGTRSVGTKIVLYPELSSTAVDYAFGIDTSTLWSSVANSSGQFKWYAGTTSIATLSGSGNFTSTGAVEGNTIKKTGGTSTQFLKADGSTDSNTYITSSSVGNGTLTLSVSGTGLSISSPSTFTANQSSNTSITVTSNATSNNTVSTIVARDDSGNFNAGVIDAVGINTDNGIRISNPGGASYSTTASSVTGAIKIRIPANALGSNTMVSFTVNVFNYVTGTSQRYLISGYNYSDVSYSWVNVSAICLTDLSNTRSELKVRFGKDGTSQCVYIGEINTTWSYPQVFITDFCGGYVGLNKDNWAKGWSISFESVAFAGVTATRTPAGIASPYNNMGQTHSSRTSFDASTPSYDFGYRYVQGSENGPGTGGNQFYSWYIGLGADYPATGAGSYGAMFAVDRYIAKPYLSVRYNENNSFTSWYKISAGYADSSGFTDLLSSTDNRSIAPSNTSTNKLQFGFTSWNNNSTSPWADYLHLRSYQDSTGGNDNLVMFRKDAIGMRLWQQTFGSSTAYSSYADVWHTGNDGAGSGLDADRLDGLDTKTISSPNLASSANWTVGTGDGSADSGTGSNFAVNGDGNLREWGIDPFGRRGLIWVTRNNDVASDADGGWNKGISGVSDSKSYVSIVYVKRATSSTNGNFYHGCSPSTTLNLDGTSNGNPYFGAFTIQYLPQNVWCVSIGFIRANGDSNTSNTGGLYRLDTGEKIWDYTDYKMSSGASSQVHRTYLYYSTDPAAELHWWGPGFYEINGQEPFISTLTSTATNILNKGTVILASATESNSIHITQPSYTTDQPVKLLNFDWYGNKWSLGNIRSGSSASNGLGVFSSGTERVRFTDSGLSVSGSISAISNITNGGYEFILGTQNQIDRGNSGNSRALVKDSGATLVLNYAGDFGGGVRIDSSTSITGSISLSGSISLGTSLTGSTSSPSNINLGNNYSNGTTRDKCKIYLYNSGTGQYGFSVGSNGDIQYHSNVTHDFYIDNSKITTVKSNGVEVLNDGSTLYGPNSTWGQYLRIGGNGNADTTNASVVATNGNLHLDAKTGGFATYLNYYKGNYGVAFGNGSGVVAWMGPDGDLWKGGGDNSGSQYWHAGNDGSGSGLDADLWDGYHLSTRTNWSTNSAGDIVVGQLSWKNYGNSHTIFDASQGTSPNGTTVSNVDSQAAWTETYPTLMGWNGANTYGVRVDRSRLSDNANSISGAVGNSYVWDGVQYFRSNKGSSSYLGSNNTYGLEAYSDDSGAAAMSFHRAGYYAVNMGLDPDNVFRIGGWSASANRWQLDMSGNGTYAGSVTASSFKISADTNNRLEQGGLVLRGSSPTIYLRDTDANVSMLHCNSNIFYVLRGSNDTETWTQVNGVYPLEINLTNNNATFGGTVTVTSDLRFKKNIRTIDNALEKTINLRGVYFEKIETEGTHIGVIAQEVEKILPEVVSENQEGKKSVAYSNMVGLLIEAIKEQQKQINNLQKEINEIKNGK